MTQEVPEGQPSAQPPPGWPYGDPPPPAGGVPPSGATGDEDAAGKRKPSRWWYVVGVGLIAAGVVAMIAFIFLAVFQGVTVFKDGIEVSVPRQVTIELPADDERMLYARPGADPACTFADADGSALPLEPSGSVSISINGDEWVGVGTFPTGSGHVELTCSGVSSEVRIGKVFGGASFVVTILLAVLTPIVLGFAGAIVLSVTGVRHYRSRT